MPTVHILKPLQAIYNYKHELLQTTKSIPQLKFNALFDQDY
jgi:hypothetical protein